MIINFDMRRLIAGTVLLVLVACNVATPGAAFLRPEDFGAAGDGIADDTAALQSAVREAGRSATRLRMGGTYRISGQVTIDQPLVLDGGGVLVADAGIEETIGISGSASLLQIRSSAPGTHIANIAFDLNGQGRTALRVEASQVHLEHIRVANYRKTIKADNRRHSKSESGIRVSASGVIMSDIRCTRMETLVPDAVPRCITIHGGAEDIRMRNIFGENINGGITVGKSRNVRIDGYRFKNLSDNGLYLLPQSTGFTATGGVIENINESVVFKGRDATIDGLRIHNQEQGFGLENASGVVLKDVTVTFDQALASRPSFMRARRGNRLPTDISLSNMDVSMPLGNAVFNLANGEVDGLSVSNVRFSLEVANRRESGLYLFRQNKGSPPKSAESQFDFSDKCLGGYDILIKSSAVDGAYLRELKLRNEFNAGGRGGHGRDGRADYSTTSESALKPICKYQARVGQKYPLSANSRGLAN